MLKHWKRYCVRAGVAGLAATVFFAAGTAEAQAKFRILQLSSNAGDAELCADGGNPISIGYLDTTFAAGYITAGLSSFSATLHAQGDNCATSAIDTLAVNLGDPSFSTIVVGFDGADDKLVLLNDDLTPPASGKVKVRLVNFNESAQTYDVTPTSEADGGTPLIDDVAPLTASSYVELDANTTLNVELRDAASSLPSVLDLGDLSLPEGSIVSLVLVGIEGDGTTPLMALPLVDLAPPAAEGEGATDGEGAIDGEGGGEGGSALVRVVHASPTAGQVETCVNGGFLDSPTFFEAGLFSEVTPGNYDFNVFPPSSNCTGSPLANKLQTINDGIAYTIVAGDTVVKGGAGVELFVFENPVIGDPGAGNAFMQFVHMSPGAPAVDLSDANSALGDAPYFDDVAYGTQSARISVGARLRALEIRDAANTQTLASLGEVNFEEGKSYTVFAVGLAAGDPPLQIALVDDESGEVLAPPPAEGEGEGTVEGAEGEGEGTVEGAEGEGEPVGDPQFKALFDAFLQIDGDEDKLLTLAEVQGFDAGFTQEKFNAADLDGSGTLTRGEIDLAKAPLDLCSTMNQLVGVVNSDVLGPLLAELGDDLDILFQLECTGSEDLNGPFPTAEGEGEGAGTSILPGPNGIPDGQFEFGVLAELVNNRALYAGLPTGTLPGQVAPGADPDAIALALTINNTLFLDVVGPFADTSVLTALLPLLIDFEAEPFNFTPPFTDPEEVETINGIVTEFQALFPGISRLIAAYATLGDEDSIGVVLAVADLINNLLIDNGLDSIIGTFPTSGFATNNAILGLNGDADGDGCSQINEFSEFGGSSSTYVAAALDPSTTASACSVVEGEGDGQPDGEGDGAVDGEGPQDGEAEVVLTFYDADTDEDGFISLSELLRIVQLYNAGAYFCTNDINSEDGYSVEDSGIDFGTGNCTPHDADFLQDGVEGVLELSELLRPIQFFNLGGQLVLNGSTEDGWDVTL
ncbi:MAG: DUF4397 domain-containing protein [Candidatus Hydrogenedens sp.]|nr:DUF4397 domain-containing protein [Candidatus Hydrogenedens sp.]